MKILLELIEHDKQAYFEELNRCNILSAFHDLCQSDPVSKLLHYSSSAKSDNILSLNNNVQIMETDKADGISAYRWDCNAKRWRSCNDGNGRVRVYVNFK